MRQQPCTVGYRRLLAVLFPSLLLIAPMCPAAADDQQSDPFSGHMRPMLTTDDEWRTPNPDYEPGGRRPRDYALQLRLQPDGKHAIGELQGVYDDGRRVTYWSLLAMYNPVTEKVVTQQIGWDGTLLYGENDVQPEGGSTLDMMGYHVNGTTKTSRHVNRYIGRDVHESSVYERNDSGEWEQTAQWTWHRVPGAEPAAVTGEHEAGAVGGDAGYLVSGSGQWRAANPDYVAGSGAAETFGMNFRWGQRKQYVIGEIVSIAGDGSVSKDWSLYITHNPVTGRSHLYQTGASGVYFHGELRIVGDGRYSQTGLVYLPNGTVKSVRDDVQILNDATQISHVFERDAAGEWTKRHEWTWVQVPGGE